MGRLPILNNGPLLRNVVSLEPHKARISHPSKLSPCRSLSYLYNHSCLLIPTHPSNHTHDGRPSSLSGITDRDVSHTSGIASDTSLKAAGMKGKSTSRETKPSKVQRYEEDGPRNPPPPQISESKPLIGSGLLKLVERTIAHGLMPTINTTSTDHGWTVTICLDQLALSAEGTAERRDLAEATAVQQFESLLSSFVTPTLRQPTGITIQNAPAVLQNYCIVVLDTKGGAFVSPCVWGDPKSGYHAQHHIAGKTLTEPVSSATKYACININVLSAAHKVISGHPDFWTDAFENQFRARILVDNNTVHKLRQIIDRARIVLDSSAPNAQGQEKEPYLDNCLAALPFRPSISRMLTLGAITHCLDAAIIFAALDARALKETAFKTRNKPAHVTESDHLKYVNVFRKLRKLVQSKPKPTFVPNSDELKYIDPEIQMEKPAHVPCSDPSPQFNDKMDSCHDFLTSHDLNTIQVISKEALSIETALTATGLLKAPTSSGNKTIELLLPGSTLCVRTQPYGTSLYSKDSPAATRAARQLLNLGFGANIAQYGYGTLVPYSEAALCTATGKRLRHAAALLPATLRDRLRAIGPLEVFSGRAHSSEDGDEMVRFLSPILPLSASLLGQKVTVPQQAADTEHAELLVNEIPVLIRSDEHGLTHKKARDLILEARKMLHKAIDKALIDFFKYGWRHKSFHDLICSLPVTGQARNVVKETPDTAPKVVRKEIPRGTWSRIDPE